MMRLIKGVTSIIICLPFYFIAWTAGRITKALIEGFKEGKDLI